MDPQRKAVPGPMAKTSLKLSRKNNSVPNTYLKPVVPHKEIVKTAHTSTPTVEHRSFPSEENQIYSGQVNVLSIIDLDKDIRCCKYSEDVREIAVGFADGTVRLFDCSTGECTHSLVDDECRSYPGPVTSIKHRPISDAHPNSNTLLSTYVNGCIKCWMYKYDQCLYTIREKRQTLGLTYHPRFCKFVAYGDDCRINMYDEESQTQERAFYSSGTRGVLDGHSSRIFACAFHPKSNHELVSGGWDDTVMCWDDRVPYATRRFAGVHMCGEGLDFDKPGKQILTCSWQEKDSIQLWDYGSCKVIETIVPDTHQSKLYCGRVVPKTSLIVCGGSEINMLRVVDTKLKITECCIRNNPGGIYGFDFGRVRRKITLDTGGGYKKISEIGSIPRVAYVSGKRLQIVDFGES
ncbi:uncharacterized protein LOC134648857 [Cydia amplana]|uniref:uncharacterized protein LOC134648857 n=1 Tax=Cydia amplana TaxID=1869771 RepID=UPI002FE684E7